MTTAMTPTCPVPDKRKVPLSIQWHITTRCGNRCRHCYVFDGATFSKERANTLPPEGLREVLRRLLEFEKRYNAFFSHFAITGGDPLLREDWQDLVGELRRRGRIVHMMGNPETLTDENLERLSALGVRSFQMSLDGLEATHDAFRSPGSFQRTVEALRSLAEHRIGGGIMFTLFPENAHELIPLLRFVAEETAAVSFAFDVGCFVGNASGMDARFRSEEIHRLFVAYLEEKERLLRRGAKLRIGEKANLLKAARYEMGTFHPLRPESVPVLSGCACGWNGVCLLSDGSVMACRRLPIKVGNLVEQSFEEVFLENEWMRRFRRPGPRAGCGSCDFYAVCRGCPASVYSLTGDCFAENPICFRKAIPRSSHQDRAGFPPPSMDASNEEEWALVAGYRGWRAAVAEEMKTNPELASFYLTLSHSPEARREFLLDPIACVGSRPCELNSEHLAFLVDRVVGMGETGAGDAERADPLATRSLLSVLDKVF